MGASWSATARNWDYSKSYPVVDYTHHALNLEEFIDYYPLVTIETTGKAISNSTFGDVGRGCFGTRTFETRNFLNTDYHNEFIVKARENFIVYAVGAEIGVGFKRVGDELYVRPFINGWIYSAGDNWRTLSFGLAVTRITFQASPYKK